MSTIAALARKAGYDLTPEYAFPNMARTKTGRERRWRFDYALVEYKIAIEIEGGVWTKGRHTRSKGFLEDMLKYDEAAAMGWLVFRTTPKDDLDVWSYVERALMLRV